MSSITKEMLNERLELLQRELQQLTRMQTMYEGALQDVNYWISIQDKEETNGETNTN